MVVKQLFVSLILSQHIGKIKFLKLTVDELIYEWGVVAGVYLDQIGSCLYENELYNRLFIIYIDIFIYM